MIMADNSMIFTDNSISDEERRHFSEYFEGIHHYNYSSLLMNFNQSYHIYLSLLYTIFNLLYI